MSNIEFYLNNGGKYPFIPRRDELDKSIYITTPTTYYDEKRGQRIFEDFLNDMVFAEELGYDGALILEQHGGPNAMVGQSVVMAAALAARTSKMRIGTVGALLNSYLTPMRYAEEVVALDYLTRGRYFFGLPMGIGPNYHGLGMMNPTHARERHREGHDMMKKAFVSEEAFEWDGKYFRTPYANLWPKPLQKPHPEIWTPAVGSKESLQFAAENHYTYLAVLVPWKILLKNCQSFRDACEQAGYIADRTQIAAQTMVHVAETDRQARQEAEAHFMSILQNSLGSPFHDSFPPGHVSTASLRGMAAGDGYRSKDLSETTFEEAMANKQFICGSPATVTEQLEEMVTAMGAGRVVVTNDAWTMPSWMTRKNMTLFAEEVMPKFRDNGKPIWDTQENSPAWNTVSEYGATVESPVKAPSAYVSGAGFVDIRTAHIPELRQDIREK